MLDTLDQIQRDIVARLAGGAANRKSAVHTPIVTTADADSRVMVLRDFESATWTLRFHTDARSPKVSVIEADPRVSVIAYDSESKVQLRLRGHGRIERAGPVADAAWAAGDNFSRRCYLGVEPGRPADGPTSGLPPQFERAEPSDADLVPARQNFAVLLVELREADWFSLAHTGHRRAIFRADGPLWEGRWIAP
ncbi:pyridoxamine 5'-phosphate oxidase family protein [Qipengyuania zhejiangensis]|uniref:pyridoxamine 5'-phosphate oxidase family protein n=1 Tax=Qipengyuania zhejiangensis TaxID=3077782 RepID=UPI002D7A08ED|nr:pyridoxamine 5'-phosphate oxidase family protein [Qipengyuania sp. Z2]